MLFELLKKVKKNDFTLGVLGLGRVGLPLATAFASKGVDVIGFDRNDDLVCSINDGICPFVEDGLDDMLKKVIAEEKLIATEDDRRIKKCDIIIISVGTPIDKNFQPDFSQIRSVLATIAKSDIKDKLIILRSTSTPVTLEELVKPYLEEETGLKAGIDFGLAVCPERIAEGKAVKEIIELPEIVGSDDQITSEIAAELFKKLNPNKRIILLPPRSAALAKLFTNVYRYVNFALANEFGLIAEKYDQDAFEIIKNCNIDYPRANIPIPGLSGGPCLTKDGYILVSDSVFPDFILMAWRLNENIPAYIVTRLKAELKSRNKEFSKCKIGVLGIGFKSGSDDLRYSPSLKLAELLMNNGVELFVHDPYVKPEDAEKFGIKFSEIDDVILKTDAIVLATNHPDYKNLHMVIEQGNPGCILFDCWGMFNPKDLKKIRYIGLGRPSNS